MVKYWHYTTLSRLNGITRDMTIKASIEFDIYPVIHLGEKLSIKGAVYLSTAQDFEPAAVKPLMNTRGDLVHLPVKLYHEKFPIVRVLVADTSQVLPWIALTKAQGVPSKERVKMIRRAKEDGSDPKRHWHGIIGDVQLASIHAELWQGGSKWEVINHG